MFGRDVKAADPCLNDTTPPVISNTHDFIYEVGQPHPNYTDGVIVTDACSYDLQISDVFVKYNEEGIYPLYYYAGDSSGNSSTITVFIYVYEDITDPVINNLSNKTIEYGSVLSDTLFLEGIFATDNYDGDLTNRIIVDYSSVNNFVLGNYFVTYTVTDQHNNSVTETIMITVEDSSAPVISGQKDHTVEVFTESINYLLEVSSTDAYDGIVPVTVYDQDVNLNLIGIYEVILTASDSHGNTTNEVITITVVDTSSPVIMGYRNHTVEVFTESINYLEGVVAIDLYDGDVAILIDDSSVTLTIVGSYDVILKAIDSYGNSSFVIITITVVDTIPPTISLYVDYVVEVFTESINYLEDVVASDLYDGTIIIDVDDRLVNLNEIGTYTVSLQAIDASLNEAEVTITVTVVDTIAPVISGYENISVNVLIPSVDYLGLVTAIDLYDGEVDVIVDDSLVNLNVVGTYEVRLIASDTQGNESSVVFNIEVIDMDAPVIYDANDFSIEVFSTNVDYIKHAKANDTYDGDLVITFDDSEVNLNVLGTYEVILLAIDASGNTCSLSIHVTVMDTTAPIISAYSDFFIEALSSDIDYIQNTVAFDLYDGQIDIIVIEPLVNLSVVGTYQVTLIAIDISLNQSSVVINVTVVDQSPPEVSGYRDFKVEVFTLSINYLEGVTAIDLYDGLVDIHIDDSNVNLNVVGLYWVTLTATDTFLNQTAIDILVTVEDTTPPEFINFEELFSHEIGTPTPDYLFPLRIEDNYDGVINLDDVIIYDNYINYFQDGVYPLIYVVTDSQGNSCSKTVHIRIYDLDTPTLIVPNDFSISLTSTNINYFEEVSATDNISGDLSEFVIVDDSGLNRKSFAKYCAISKFKSR